MQIKDTLPRIKSATWSVELPSVNFGGMPAPTGTGFFVSSDGWFVTAAHVVTSNNQSDGPVRNDITDGWLGKELTPVPPDPPRMLQGLRVEAVISECDLALLHLGFDGNKHRAFLEGATAFSHIDVSTRQLDEGESVYSFGYPLGSARILTQSPQATIGERSLSPRTTSGIVAGTIERTALVQRASDAQLYVMDKALNYGNSGGPIVAVDTGHVHALCSRFQPVTIPQGQDAEGNDIVVHIPSLYGIAMSLRDPRVQKAFRDRGVPLLDT